MGNKRDKHVKKTAIYCHVYAAGSNQPQSCRTISTEVTDDWRVKERDKEAARDAVREHARINGTLAGEFHVIVQNVSGYAVRGLYTFKLKSDVRVTG